MEKGFFKLLVALLFFLNWVYAQELEKVDFIQEGEISKLILKFDKEVFAERKHIKKDKQIILDIKNVKAKKRQLRGIDTSEFTGSAVYISGYKKPGTENDLRFAIQLRDNVRSILEKKNDNTLILSIENRFGVFSKKKLDRAEQIGGSEDLTALKQKIHIPKSESIEDILENLTLSGVKRYVGKKISIHVQDLPFPDLLRMIADTSGFNIIIDNEISKLSPVTLNLTNIPWDQALDTILNLGNLVALRHANILTVKTEAQVLTEREKELEAKSKNAIKEPLVTKIFPLSFADQKELIAILSDYTTKDRGSIKADTRTNSLIVKDTAEVIERMKKIITTLDTQTPQILIESKIVEASEKYSFSAGLRSNGLQFSYDPISSDLGGNAGSFSFNSAPDAENAGVFGASISVFKRLTNLNFTLELMESESKGRIISSPRVITKNNMPATIATKKSTYIPITGATTTTGGTTTTSAGNLTSIDAEINLTVTPQVTNDGSISMQVDIKKSDFTTSVAAGNLPDTTENNISTNVLVENGSTVVVGGLYKSNSREVQSGIPFLKDLPLIGWLFKTAYNPSNEKEELIVFLTPRIINQEEAGLVSESAVETGIE